MKIVYLLLATVFIFLIIFGSLFLVDFIAINTLTVRSEDMMISSAWSGLTEIDFNELAIRNNLDNEQNRDIYIDKIKAEEKIMEYIKSNFRLDDSFLPLEDSFISIKDRPLIIKTFEIYNPDDFKNSNIKIMGKNIERTSVYIYFKVPINITLVGDVYKEIHIIVDSKTFYSSNQR